LDGKKPIPNPSPRGREKSPTPTLPIREGESNTSPPQWGGFRRGLEDLGEALW